MPCVRRAAGGGPAAVTDRPMARAPDGSRLHHGMAGRPGLPFAADVDDAPFVAVRKGGGEAAMELPDKALFRIGEVASLVGVPTHVIRFWQREFPQLRPGRTGTGRLLFGRAQVELLGRIRQLLHVEGMTIDGARRALKSGKAEVILADPTAPVRARAGRGAAKAAPVEGAAPPTVVGSQEAAPSPGSALDVAALRGAAGAIRRELEALREALEEL